MTDTFTQAGPLKAMAAVLPTTTTPKRPTKKAQLIKLLSRKAGADTKEISVKFGWQPHTMRAALWGLRKAGFDVKAERAGAGKPMRYGIVINTAVGVARAEATNGQ